VKNEANEPATAVTMKIAQASRSTSTTCPACVTGFVKRGGAKRLAVERFDGEPVTETPVMPLLVEAGFLAGPRRAVLRA